MVPRETDRCLSQRGGSSSYPRTIGTGGYSRPQHNRPWQGLWPVKRPDSPGDAVVCDGEARQAARTTGCHSIVRHHHCPTLVAFHSTSLHFAQLRSLTHVFTLTHSLTPSATEYYTPKSHASGHNSHHITSLSLGQAHAVLPDSNIFHARNPWLGAGWLACWLACSRNS